MKDEAHQYELCQIDPGKQGSYQNVKWKDPKQLLIYWGKVHTERFEPRGENYAINPSYPDAVLIYPQLAMNLFSAGSEMICIGKVIKDQKEDGMELSLRTLDDDLNGDKYIQIVVGPDNQPPDKLDRNAKKTE